jgi:hypothetical protein
MNRQMRALLLLLLLGLGRCLLQGWGCRQKRQQQKQQRLLLQLLLRLLIYLSGRLRIGGRYRCCASASMCQTPTRERQHLLRCRSSGQSFWLCRTQQQHMQQWQLRKKNSACSNGSSSSSSSKGCKLRQQLGLVVRVGLWMLPHSLMT